jgi:hypothetical protein
MSALMYASRSFSYEEFYMAYRLGVFTVKEINRLKILQDVIVPASASCRDLGITTALPPSAARYRERAAWYEQPESRSHWQPPVACLADDQALVSSGNATLILAPTLAVKSWRKFTVWSLQGNHPTFG